MIDPTVRNDFYGLDKKIFFNNASYGPLLKTVRQSIDEYLEMLHNLKVGDAEAKDKLQQIRECAATLIGASTAEVEFAINTSWGINLAVLGLDYRAGDEILIPENEFPSVPYPFKALQEKGVVIKYIPTPGRNFSFEEMTRLVSPHTRVLALSFVQFFNGFRNDLRRIGEFCAERDIFFIVDAIQGLGVCPLDVKECRIDLLACGAQKWLLSPLGSGFFYISRGAKRPVKSLTTGWLGVDWGLNYTDIIHFDLEPFDDARRYNLGTYPYIQLWGMEAALRYILSIGVEPIFAHTQGLLDRLISYLQEDEFYTINSSLEPQHRSQIINIGSPLGEDLHRFLLKEGIMQVYREGGVRVAVHLYNTLAEIDRLVEALSQFKERHSHVATRK